MALVKCVYCGIKKEKTESFKVEKFNKANNYNYYCSEEEYKEYIKVQEDIINQKEVVRLQKEELKKEKEIKSKKRKEVIDYIADEFLYYEKGMVFPSSLNKEISKLNEFYPFEVILESMKRGSEAIKWAMNNKDFTNDFGKVRYIIAVAEGSINQVYKEFKKKQDDSKKEKLQTITYIDDIKLDTHVKKKQSNSILEFLSEDEL